MPACQGPQYLMQTKTAQPASFIGYLYIVSQYTVRLMTPCVWRILCLRNSSSVPYFRQPPNLPTAARRNRKIRRMWYDWNRMSAESAHLSTFGAETETETEIRSTSNWATNYATITRFVRLLTCDHKCLESDDTLFLSLRKHHTIAFSLLSVL